MTREAWESQWQAEKEFKAVSEIVFECYIDNKLTATVSTKSEAKAYKVENETAKIVKVTRSKAEPEHVFCDEVIYFDYERVEKPFDQNLKLAITESGKTMKEIAELLNIPYRTIQDWKAGRRTPATYMQQSILNQIKSL